MLWKSKIIPRTFYDRSPVEVTKELLGTFLVRKLNGQYLVGKIIETEAYLSEGDAAAHGFKGKSSRNKSLYGEPGHAYVHTLRQYSLLDIVTEKSSIPSSVLIRTIEPTESIEKMKQLRNYPKGKHLADGPGKVCMALGITKTMDGIDMADKDSILFVCRKQEKVLPNQIITSGRIGISKAKELELRFRLVSKNKQK